ncbi:MAG: hypothetical protein WBE58_18850 [Verrucomicrobiales bacterium]|nr:hypothetical protein [Verrucomicrobiales bacterium]
MSFLTIDSLLIACPACLGADDASTTAANFAIGFMLLVVVAILGSLLAFIKYLSKRSREFGSDLSSDPSSKG